VPLDVLDIIKLGRKRISNVDDDDFPIGLAFIEESHNTEDFNLLDLSNIPDLFTNLANVKWVIITLCLGLSMRL
jgi:hypothetical protein